MWFSSLGNVAVTVLATMSGMVFRFSVSVSLVRQKEALLIRKYMASTYLHVSSVFPGN